MATTARIPAPLRMRVDASVVGRFAPSPWRIVHLGQSAIVLGHAAPGPDTSGLAILTTAGAGVMPGGASLPASEFARLRAGVAAAGSARVELEGWTTAAGATVETVDLALECRGIAPTAIGALRSALDAIGPPEETGPAEETGPPSALLSPDPFRRLASRLARQAVAGDVRPALLHALVGAGPGTTPSGDDVIVGAMAGLRACGLADAATSLGRRVLPLLPATTTASGHYLRAAADGRFGEHVHELIDSLETGRPAAAVIARASRWGATSGVDLLFGLVAVLAIAAGRRATEEAA
jgi:hypothetical protein